jgi:CRISPR-associated exonuclease Cas4
VTEQWFFDVTDIKQYACCPRLVYYHTCLPDIRPLTYTMQVGIQSHQQEEDREIRRNLHQYGLEEGKRLFHYAVCSEKLGLKGLIDLVIVSPSLEAQEKVIIPVEYKYSEQQAGVHFKLQLAAYALLLEEAFQVPVQRAFLYSIPRRKAEEVMMTSALRKRVRLLLQEMHDLLSTENMPAPTKAYRRCPTCEFRRFCNDVV